MPTRLRLTIRLLVPGPRRAVDNRLVGRSATILGIIRLMDARGASKGPRMIQEPDDEEPADGRVAGTEPTKRVRRGRPATMADIRAAIRRIEERESAGQRRDG